MKPLLDLTDVNYTYQTAEGETPAVKNLSFRVFPDHFLGIIGPSGCGKSTILSLIAGLIQPNSGKIAVSAEIGYMLQKDHLFEWRTIYKNVILGLEIQDRITEKNLEHVEQLLRDYGLDQFRNARPSELSGGMRQRAALIRTLALDPELLLLDEPFSALDYQTRLTVCDDVRQIIRQEKKTAILVTHDLSEAISMADRVLVLSKRPATIHLDLPTIFENQTLSPMNRRQAPEFQGYFNQIWKELNHHE